MTHAEQPERPEKEAAETEEVAEPWGHPGPPTVAEVPPAVEKCRREATRRQQRMTEDKTGEAE